MGACLLDVLLLRPRVAWHRPLAAWLLQTGSIFALYAIFFLVFQRPWFAAVSALALYLFVLVVNRVKLSALREPFIFQDLEYFTDLLRHPRLYLPFFGFINALVGVIGAGLLIGAGLWLEDSMALQEAPKFWCVALAYFGMAWFVSRAGMRGARCLLLSFDAGVDVARLGLLASMWLYAREERILPKLPARFEHLTLLSAKLPQHLIAVQSESFFDARRAWPGISPEVYRWLDQARSEATRWGLVGVPAWGANTVRSEFAVLSGLNEHALGVHRFNPYRSLRVVQTLARVLRESGYRTVCVHPYAAAFYRRELVFPGFGFDEFVDVRAFADSDRAGPYVGDVAVAERVVALINSTAQPLFVFVITMENHGPLHLERMKETERSALFTEPAERVSSDLSVYLRHIHNAGLMWQRLRECLLSLSCEASLCWYGDHVPILTREFARANFEDPRTDYFCWSNKPRQNVLHEDLLLSELAERWLSQEHANA